MPTSSIQKSNNILIKRPRIQEAGFSLIEILVALVLAAFIFLAVPDSENVQRHRDLQTAVDDMDRSIRFAGNEAVLRNSVVRLKLSLDKSPVEYTVEYGPSGNLPLPEATNQSTKSLLEAKEEKDEQAALDRQFNKVEEFEDIKHEFSPNVTLLGVATTSQNNLIIDGEANLYFYPTGEKDGSLLILATLDEVASLEVSPFLSDTLINFHSLNPASVARIEDILQTKMEEIYNQWLTK